MLTSKAGHIGERRVIPSQGDQPSVTEAMGSAVTGVGDGEPVGPYGKRYQERAQSPYEQRR